MAKVSFKRIENSSGINDVPVVDGQVIYTGDGKQYMDYGTNRVEMSSGGGSGSSQGIILWTNEHPDRQFQAQTYIYLPDEVNNCYEYEVICLDKYNSTNILRTGRIPKDRGTWLQWASSSDYEIINSRHISPIKTEYIGGVEKTYISIGSCGYIYNSVSDYALIRGADDYKLIPLYIIGYTDKSFNY